MSANAHMPLKGSNHTLAGTGDFRLELLEARVLLSAEPLAAWDAGHGQVKPSEVEVCESWSETPLSSAVVAENQESLWEGVESVRWSPLLDTSDASQPGGEDESLVGDDLGGTPLLEKVAAPLTVGGEEVVLAASMLISTEGDEARLAPASLPNENRGPPAASLVETPVRHLTDIVLGADVYTNGDNKLFEGNLIIAAGKSVIISTGPLGGNIYVEGNLNGTADPGNLAESLTIIAGSGDLFIRGDIGNATPLQNLTIVSAGRVVVNGNIQVLGQLRIINTTGSINLGVPLVEGGPAGNILAGSVEISTEAELTIHGALTTSGGAPSIVLAARPVSGTGNINLNGNLTTDGPLTLTEAGNVRFQGVVAVAGDLRQLRGFGTTTFDRQVAARALDLATAALVFNDRVSVAAGQDLVLSADEIDFNGGPGTVTSGGVDNSTIILRPTQAIVPIKLGTAAGANVGVLDLSVNDLNAISDKFGGIIVGWEGSPDTPAALQRRAMTAVTAGGSDLAAAWLELRSPGLDNDLRFTANVLGASMNGVVVRIFDDATMAPGVAEARYYATQRLLAINVRLFDTTAAAVLDAVNNHTKVGDTPAEYDAGNRPFTVTAGSDYTTGLGVFETVISDRTAGGADAVPASAMLAVPGENNDLLFTATAPGMGNNGATLVLLNRDVAAVSVQYQAGSRILFVQARLVDGPHGAAHTQADIITAINAAGVPFTAASAPTDANTDGLLEMGRADLTNAAQFHAASIRVINNVTAPASLIMSAWAGGILTPVAGVMGTSSLTATATGPIQLNTNVATVQVTATANGDILLGEADALTVLGASTAGGSIYIVNAAGDLTLAAGGGVRAGGTGNLALLAAAGLLQNSNIQTDGGSISLQALNGPVTMAGTVQTVSNGGNVRYAAVETLAVAFINAGGGRISLWSANGSISDANAAALNLQGAQLRLASGGQAGAPADLLEIFVDTVAGAANGGFYLTESDDLVVGAVSVTVQVVNSNLSTATQTDATLNGLTTQAGGHGVLVSLLGSLTVDQGVVAGTGGNLRLTALAANRGIVLNAPVTTDTGHVSMLAGRDITQNTGGNVVTGGGTVDVEAGGAILMQNGVTTTSGGGNIRYQAAGRITLGGLNAGTGNVSVISTGNEIVDGGDNHPEITAAQGRLSAVLGLGAGANHLDLAVATLAAAAASGGVFITNVGALTIDQVGPMAVNRVQVDGATPAGLRQVDGALSDVVASAGPVVVVTQNGHLTINGGGDANGVLASGNMLLQAQGTAQDLLLNAGIRSNVGHITLLAARDINLSAEGDVFTPNGDVDVQAQSGSLNMADGAVISAMGNITVAAAGDVVVGAMLTMMNNVSVTAGGAILDNDDTSTDFGAVQLRLAAGTGIGNGANLMDLTVQMVAATAGGGLFLSNSGALTIGALPAVSAIRVQSDGGQQVISHAPALAGVTTTAANGRLVVQTLDGTLNVNQAVSTHGSGNLLLLAQTAGNADKDILLNASVSSVSGWVSVVANRHVMQAATAAIATGGAGTVDVEAETGRIEMADGALTQSGGGTIRYAAAANVLLSGLDAGTGDVSVLSSQGSILDNGDAQVDIRAGNVRLAAGTAIGQSSNPLETQITALAAQAANGGLFVQEADALTVALVGPVNSYRVRAAGTTTLLTDAAMTGLTTTGGNGPIVIRTSQGTLTVQQTITTHGTGNILVEAGGANADIQLGAPVVAPAGHVTLLAARDVWQQAAGDLSALGGTLDVAASAGSINMADGALSETGGGHILYVASNDITVGGLSAGAGTVSLQAGRAVLDGGDSHTDIAAAAVRVVAGAGVGLPADALELLAGTLAAQAGDGVFLNDGDDLIIGSVAGIQVRRVAANGGSALHPATPAASLAGVATAGGDYSIILWTLNGALTVNSSITASGAGNILLRTQSGVVNDKDIFLNASVSSGGGHLSIVANRNVSQAATATLATGGVGTLSVEALNGSITMQDNGLASASAISAAGNIRYRAAQNVTLGSLNTATGDVSLSAGAGGIFDGGDRAVDILGNNVRLTAGTTVGAAGNSLELSVAVLAARAAAGGVYLSEASEVTVGTVGVVAARRVQTDASTATNQDAAALAGLVTAANNGPVVLLASGSVTVNQPVTAHGTGNILLSAGAQTGNLDLALNAAVSTTSGHISLLAARHLTQTSDGDITTNGGTVDAQAFGGNLSMADGAYAQSDGGVIRYAAGGNVTLGGLLAGSGGVSVTAAAGTITDGGGAHVEISAGRAQLVAGAGIGNGSDHLEMAVTTLAAQSNAGGLFIVNSGALSVDTVSAVIVNRVDADGTTPVALRQTDAARSDIVVTGSVVLQTSSGRITVNDGTAPAGGMGITVQSGHLLLRTQTTGDNIQVNAVVSVSGSVSLMAAGAVNQAATGHVLATAGTVEVSANAFTMADGARLVTQDAHIRLFVAGDMVLSGVQSGAGMVSAWSQNGSILDAGDTREDITAAQARLVAGIGVGQGDNHLEINVNGLAASATSGGIFLTNAGHLTVDTVGPVTVNRVDSDGSVPAGLRLVDNALSDVVTSSGNGSIVLRTVNGSLTVNDGAAPADATGIRAHGTGNIRLETRTTGADDKTLTLNAAVRSTAGRITLLSNAAITQAAAGDLLTGAATIEVESLHGGISMADGAVAQTSGGTLRYRAVGDIVVGGLLNGTGDVSLLAGGSILDGGDADVDVQAARLRLVAGNGAGTGMNALDTVIAVLAARAGAGGLFLTEADALTVDALGVMTVSRVDSDGSTPLALRITDAALTEVRTTGGGAIVLTAANGSLTVNQSVVADTTGNIRLAAFSNDADEMDVMVNAAIVSGSGHVTVFANRDVRQSVVGSLTTGGGAISVDASTGSIVMENGALTASGGGPVRYFAAGDVRLGGLNAGAGIVSVTAATGRVLDNGDAHPDITAAAARLVGAGGIGTHGNALDTAVATLAARAFAGGIFVLEEDGLVVDGVGPMVISRVAPDGTDSPAYRVNEAALSDVVTTGGNASIVLQTLNGSLTVRDGAHPANGVGVSAHGSGHVLLEAQTTSVHDKDVQLFASVTSGTGSISLLANRHVIQETGGTIRTGGAGTIEVEARRGSATMQGNALATTAGGNVRYKAAQDVTLTTLDAGGGDVSVLATAGSVLDGGDLEVEVLAHRLRLAAGNGIGTLGTGANALETNVAVLSARAEAGGINIVEANAVGVDDVAVTVYRVAANGTLVLVNDAAQSDLVTTSGNGSIVLSTLGGTITMNSGTAPGEGVAVRAHGTGHVRLAAGGQDADLLLNANIVSSQGHVTLVAGRHVILGAGVEVQTGAGSVVMDAGAGGLTMEDSALIQSATGAIRLRAANSIVLGGIATGGNVSLIATGGSILDGGDAYLEVVANGLRLVAGVGIGQLGASANALEINVATVSARAAGGGINLLESNHIAIDSVAVVYEEVQADGLVNSLTDGVQGDLRTTAGNGSIVLRTLAGALTLNDGLNPADGMAANAHGSGNVLLMASGSAGDLVLNAGVQSAAGSISLRAERDIIMGTNVNVVTQGAISVNAGRDLVMQGRNRLDAGNGDIILQVQGDAAVSGIATTGNVSIAAATGSILDADDTSPDVTAGGLRMQAAVGVGTLGAGANGLEVAVNTVSARAGAGGLHLLEANALTVDGVSATITEVQEDGSVVTITAPLQSDLAVSQGGSIVVRTTAGSLTLNDGTAPANGAAVTTTGSGNVHLSAGAAGSVLQVNANVQAGVASAGGHVTVAARAILMAANSQIFAGGVGTLNVVADAGSLTMHPTASLVSGGDMRVSASADAILGMLAAPLANVAITATNGSITNAGVAAPLVNVNANQLRLAAGTGVGVLGANASPLRTSVSAISARATGGGIHVLESDALAVDDTAVTVQAVQVDATLSALTEARQNDLQTTAGNGSIVLVTTAGSLTLNEGTPSNLHAVSAHGTGQVLLAAGGAGASFTANSDVRSLNGHITVQAAAEVTFNNQADIVTGGHGTIYVEAAGGSVTMSNNSQFFGGLGSIRVAARNDVTVGNITTLNHVSIIAATGSILDGSTFHANNLFASGARLVAAGSIGRLGVNADPLETDIATVAARAGAGGINLSEVSALSVDRVAVTVNRVLPDANVEAVTDAALADVVTEAGGSIRLSTTSGALTLVDGGDGNGEAVRAAGAGHILLRAGGAAGDVLANASVNSGSGQVTLLAGRHVNLAAQVMVSTGSSGTINVEAGAGNLTMHAASSVVSAVGDIRVVASQNAVLGRVASAGNVAVTASAGSITDAGGASYNIEAAQMRLVAANSVGTVSAPLRTQAAQASARAGAGGVFVLEADALLVTQTSATVQKVQDDATLQAVTEAPLRGVNITDGNGPVVLRTAAGTLTLAARGIAPETPTVGALGGGNVLLSAGGASSQVVLLENAWVQAGTGHVTLLAGQGMVLASQARVATTGTGTINLEAAGGDIVMEGTASIASGTGAVRLRASLGVALGEIKTAGNVSITALSGSITNARSSGTNVMASQLRLVASVGVGMQGAFNRPLELAVNTVSARASNGGVNLVQFGPLAIGDTSATVQVVQNDATVQAITDSTQSDVITTAGNGSILIQVREGGLTLNDGTGGLSGVAVSAHGSGNIALHANDVDGDLTAQANVFTGGGHVTLVANRQLQLNATVAVQTGEAGTVYLEALVGSVTMHDTARVSAAGGDIRVAAGQNIIVGGLSTQANLSLVAGGSILDGGDTWMDVTADNLRLFAGGAIGTLGAGANALETTVTYVSARAAGAINLLELDSLTVDDTYAAVQRVRPDGVLQRVEDATQSDVMSTANNGSIVLRTLNGSLSLNDGQISNDRSVQAHGSGNVLLQAGGANYNVDIGADVRSGSGHITILGGRDVTLDGAADVVTSGVGNVVVEAIAGSVLMDDNSLFQTGTGTVRVAAAMDITLGGIETGGYVSLIAATGSIWDGGEVYREVTSVGLRMTAGMGIGTLGAGANALELSVSLVAARAAGGGINLLNSGGWTVDSVIVLYQQVQTDALTAPLVEAPLSGLTTMGGNGSIVAQNTAGNLILNDRLMNGQAVVAHGTGNVLLQVVGVLHVNADVISGNGHLTVLAQGNAVFGAEADLITSADGTILLQSATGAVTMSDNTLFASGSGDVKVMAQGHLTVGGISTAGQVSLTSAAGSILDGGDRYHDVVAGGLRLWAAHGIGTLGAASNPLEISVDTLAASAGAGGISLLESNAVTVGDVSALAQRVQADATIQPMGEAVLSDLVAGGTGSVVLRNLSGTITLNDGDDLPDGFSVVAGRHILLQAGGADVALNASVSSESGHISVIAGRDISLAPFVSIGTAGSGTIEVEALSGSVLLDARSGLFAQAGNIRIKAAQNAALTGVSTQGQVSIITVNGSVWDAGEMSRDVTAAGLRLQAGNGIGVLGSASNAMEIAVDIVSARAGVGGINLLEGDAVTVSSVSVTVQTVNGSGLLQTVTDAEQGDLVAAGGGIVFRTVAGTITLLDGNAPLDGRAISIAGGGHLLVAAGGAAADLDIQSAVITASGSMTLTAGRHLLASAAAALVTNGGTIDLESMQGNLRLAHGTLVQTSGGNIRLTSGGEILVSRLDARNEADRLADTVTHQGVWGSITLSAQTRVREAGVLPSGGASIYANALRLAAGEAVGGFLAPQPVTYRLQVSSNLIHWSDLTTVTSAEGQFQFTDTPPSGTILRFYRVLSSDATVSAAMMRPALQANGSVQLAWQRVDTEGLRGALHVEAATLAAAAGSGGLNVVEATGVTVDSVAIAVNRVNANGTATAAAVQSGSDLRATGNGTVVLRTLAGNLVLEAGGADNLAVSVGGTGNVLLAAEGTGTDVTLRADVQSAGGHVTVQAARHLTFGVQADVLTTGGGSVNLEAATGNLTLSGSSRVRSDTGHVRLYAQGNVSLTGVRTGGQVAITAMSGAVSQAGDLELDVIAAGLRLYSGAGIGTSSDNLALQTNALSASAAGSLFLVQTGPLTVSDVAVSVQKVLASGMTAPVIEQPQGGVATTANNGALLLRVLQGGLTLEAGSSPGGVGVSAHGSGNVLLEAEGALHANAHIVAATGNITVLSGRDMTIGPSVRVDTNAAASLYLRAAAGTLRMADSAALRTNTGNIRLEAGGNVVLGLVDARFAADRAAGTLTTQAGWGSVSIMANGAILDAALAQDTSTRIFASALRLWADGSIGAFDTQVYRVQFTANFIQWENLAVITSDSAALTYTDANPTGMRFYRILGQDGREIPLASTLLDNGGVRLDWQRPYGLNALEIETRILAASAGAPGINLLEQTAVTVDTVSVTVNQVRNDGSTVTLAETAKSDLVAAGSGALVLRTVNGSLVLNEGTSANGLAVDADGHVLLLAGGAGSDLVLNAGLRSFGGSVSLQGGRHLTLASGVVLQTAGTGTMELWAQNGSLTMSTSSHVQTDGGNIRLRAQQDVTLALVDARTPADRLAGTRASQSNWGAISIHAVTGVIQETDVTAAKIVDVFGSVARLTAAVAVGEQAPSANPLETEVITIAINTGNEGLNVLDMTGLSVDVVGTVPAYRVGADGNITTVADPASLSGAVKTGGLATILSDLQLPIGNYPEFTVLNTVDINTAPQALTGLYHQNIRISNPTGSTIDSVRIYLRNLPANARVPYANGMENGVPYVQYNHPLAGGESRVVTIEYVVPTRDDLPSNVVIYPIVTAPLPAIQLTGATPVDFGFTRQADNRYSLVIATQAGRDYYIEYSDDNINWTTVLVPVRGTGSVVFWYDVGPPKTYPDPAGVEVRFYRVLRV
ncbi:hypothetical protein NXS98_03575 [Fontisphaera persica]|uniref:hypothetical protein n=1 Tax=Fontisphaera persica TaxID=2974023 RepID=UPI0024C0D292|nr:hypothetical protein [Fontisphaera persica]WCJ60221.1 hypothetical protein NXS98_03575 [Fontisphaera persica]